MARPAQIAGSHHEVTLAAGHSPLFPECCVACCGQAQTARRHRSVRTGRWQLLIPIALPGPAWFVPYCRACADRTRKRLLLLRLLGFPVFFVALLASITLAQSVPGLRAMWLPVALIFAVALCFPVLMWGAAWSPPFDAMISGKFLRCRFRSRDYANAFERMNRQDESLTTSDDSIPSPM